MAKGILKEASDFPSAVGHNVHEIRSIKFAADTKPPCSQSENSNFNEMRKLEEMKPIYYSLSYWTLRFDDLEKNQEYLNWQREEVNTSAKYLLIA